jgi:hypothetical protein
MLAARLEQQQQPQGGNPRRRVGVRVEGLGDVVIGPVRRSLWMLFAAVALVLAAACANIANLLLARMSVRAREIVTRAALGAGRARLARQFLMESLCLGLAGSIGGMAIARWGMSLLAKIGYARIPRAHEIGLDWQAFAFLLATGIATAVIFGLAPAFMAARLDGQSIMKGSSAGLRRCVMRSSSSRWLSRSCSPAASPSSFASWFVCGRSTPAWRRSASRCST